MPQLVLEIPDSLRQRLERLAEKQQKSVEQLAVEQLSYWLERPPESLEERYERFIRESGLFIEVPEQEQNRCVVASRQEREELAQKFGQGKPLSEIIKEERGGI